MCGGQTGLCAAMQLLVPVERELLAFAAFWFVVGLVDELAVDLAWIWLRLTGRATTVRLPPGHGGDELAGPLAVLIPTFQEATVIGATVGHLLAAWPQRQLRLYVGCYANDPATLAAASAAAGADPRVRIVVHAAAGPTTKADCLNRLYAALCEDEQRSRQPYRGVVLHDAEDMVHPAALAVIDAGLGRHDFVQLPVRPVPQAGSRWIAGHYGDEFAEAHGKALVVRSHFGAALPAAGVGCGFARHALTSLAERRRANGGHGPFATECLTEDYELGLAVSRLGRGGAFVRVRAADGTLVATGSHFPTALDAAVRQKTRWVHGIAFQAWDRLGWTMRPVDLWMALRDRRGPLSAIVLGAAYLLVAVDLLLLAGQLAGVEPVREHSPAIAVLAALGLAGLVWRGMMRLLFTAREYGLAEGLLAVARIPLANVIAMMAGRRALQAYLATLQGAPLVWDKTEHATHPAHPRAARAQA